jgi:hypothetical protein
MEELPKTSIAEKAGPVVRGSAGAIPFVGTAIAEAYNTIFVVPMEKRRWTFVEALYEDLVRLREKVDGISDRDLSENLRFGSAMATGILVATRTHQREKLNALRNAILNSALPTSPDEDLVTVFLNIIDTFTPWHLRVLAFFENPMKTLKNNGLDLDQNWASTPIWSYMKTIYSDLKGKEDLWGLILADLVDRRLLHKTYKEQSAEHATLTSRGLTPFGIQFLQFVRDPLA